MSDSDTTSTTSPPGRRRKQTIMGDSPPDIQGVTPDVDISVTAANKTVLKEEIVEEKLDIPVKAEDEQIPVNGQDNDYEHENGILPIRDDVFLEAKDHDTTKDKYDDSNVENTTPAQPPNDIIYDETKPKRLHHPRPAKLDIEKAHGTEHGHHALRESISFLISPDEPEENTSPTRRRRKQLPSTPSCTAVPKSDDRSNETSPKRQPPADVTNGATLTPPLQRHYQKSPELPRRKVSSPVQRLIVKNGQVAQAVAANSRQRKSSTEGRLNYADQALTQEQLAAQQRRRKISSDARLEHRKSAEELLQTSEKIRTRKVSFDTTALFNGNKVNVPLNDGRPTLRLSLQEEPEFYSDENSYQENPGARRDLGARPKQRSPPRVVYPGDDDIGMTESYPADKHSNSDVSEEDEGEEGYASGCDNRAYVADDEDSLNGRTPRMPPPTYQEYNNYENKNPDDDAAVISHTETYDNPKTLTKQRSCSSLPASFGRGVSDDDSGVYIPKSILKVRPMDADSMVSEDSIAGKAFKVRKDSIALFMDTNTGNVSIEELRKEFDHRRWKCFGKKDIKQIWADRKQLVQKYKLHLLVVSLFALTFAFVIVGLHFHSKHHKYVATAQKVFFDGKTRVITLNDYDAIGTFSGKLGFDIPGWKHPTHCYTNYAQVYDKTCLKWKEHGTLDVLYFQGNHTNCYNVSWSLKPGTFPFDCYDLGHSEWYGPVNSSSSQWPIRSEGFTFNVNGAKHHGSGTFASAVEFYWVSSNGEAVVVDSNYPIEISWNKRRLGSVCIIGKETGDFYNSHDASLRKFQYTVCNGRNILDTHKYVRDRFLTKVSKMPSKSVLEFPHWSTVWGSDNTVVNDSTVQYVADSVIAHEMNCSTIEIDGQWESHYGDLTFNRNNFPNLTNTMDTIVRAGCTSSLNVYPFFNSQSSNFQEGVNRNFFVKNVGGEVTSLLRWQHGIGAMLDASNHEARDWFTGKLRRLSTDHNIDTFTLRYGSHAWVPSKPNFAADKVNPSKLKLMFSAMLASVGDVIIQSTAQSQHVTSLLSVHTSVVQVRDTKCIQNIIPDVLTLGIMGYPFVLSDGLSTNSRSGSHENGISRELFIRWMQLAAFLPAMRYTIKPWEYDKEVVAAGRNLTSLHSNHVVDAIYRKQEKIFAGDPVIKPMWWMEPNDSSTMVIDDQFIVADTYLVAPILCDVTGDQVDSTRDIYIPSGVWKDMVTEKIILGPRWLRGYKASLFHIPYFERMAQYDDEKK